MEAVFLLYVFSEAREIDYLTPQSCCDGRPAGLGVHLLQELLDNMQQTFPGAGVLRVDAIHCGCWDAQLQAQKLRVILS